VTVKDPLELLQDKLGLNASSADLLLRYLRAGTGALGAVPSKTCIVAERFFDEAGGMQLILHAPFGGRINRAWGLALRKRFCRSFDFELQAAASDDGILLSLGEQHSFPLADIFDFLSPNNVEEVLVQAVLQSPIFGTRFRWDATRSLALSRFSMGKRVPPHLQRARADDLLAAVFPAQAGCQDNHGGGDVELPDHPIVKEAMHDCLRDAMDVDGLIAVLKALKSGEIKKVAVDTPEPSVLAHQMLNSAPYTYLDDAPLEERRARAVTVRRTLPAGDQAAFGALDADAIISVINDAQPLVRDEEELHDALLQLIALEPGARVQVDREWISLLQQQERAAAFEARGRRFLVAAERVAHVQALYPGVVLDPPLQLLPGDKPVDVEVAALAAARGWMETLGPVTVGELAAVLALDEPVMDGALFKLESEGQVLRGAFRPGQPAGTLEWCDRRLLQRIHRQTVGRLRAEIQPLSAQDFMRFLFRWHHLEADDLLRGTGGLAKAVSLLQGFEAPAAAWEQVLLPLRMKAYAPELLERSCWTGEVAWGRLTLKDAKAPVASGRRGDASVKPPTPAVNRVLRAELAASSAARAEADAMRVAAFRAVEGAQSSLAVSGANAMSGGSANGSPGANLISVGSDQADPLRARAEAEFGAKKAPTFAEWQSTKAARTGRAPAEEPRRASVPGRNASLTFVRREEMDWMLTQARPHALLADGPRPLPEDLSHAAHDVAEVLGQRGACFFTDLVQSSKRLPAEVEDALWELLARGLVSSDAVDNLRVLQSPKARKRQRALQRGGPGRWSLLVPHQRYEPADLLERTAKLFLNRYGIVWRDLVQREPLAPSWRELLYVYRRLEARGEIRGGRFCSGFAGEQFALPDAVDLARAVRRSPKNGNKISISAVDPLNLTGVVTPGPRVPSIMGGWVTYVDGVPEAAETRAEEAAAETD
jgi:hypothetical protein